jgi:nucleoside 2-deoxyribosyltransferase
MSVYLAGPINGCSDAEAGDWRATATAVLHSLCIETVDPMRRDYRGAEEDNVSTLVEDDKADIRDCGAVLANCWTVSVGTSMEILYAYQNQKIVVLVIPPGQRISPWYRYHATQIVTSIEEGVRAVFDRIAASSGRPVPSVGR